MKKVSCCFALIFLFTIIANAEEVQYKIKQVLAYDKIAILEVSESAATPIGSVFLATFEDGKQCSLYVLSRSGNFVTLDSSKCEASANLRVNQPVEASLYTPTKVQSKVQERVQESESAVTGGHQQDRSISDMSYLPPAGKITGTFTFAIQNLVNTVYSGSTQILETKTRETNVNASIGYGISDDFNFSLDIGYMPTSSSSYEPAGTTYSSSGWKEPTFGLQYRLISQSASTSFDVVLDLDYSPQTMKAISATDTDNGNAGRGAGQTEIGLGIYRRLSTVELGMNVNFATTSRGEKADATTSEITEMSPTDRTTFSGVAQFKLSDSFYLNGGIGFRSYSFSEERIERTGKLYKTAAYGGSGVLFGARFVIIPKKSVLDFHIQSLRADDIEMTLDTVKVKVKEPTQTALLAVIRSEF